MIKKLKFRPEIFGLVFTIASALFIISLKSSTKKTIFR